jgi:hypothetical protein
MGTNAGLLKRFAKLEEMIRYREPRFLVVTGHDDRELDEQITAIESRIWWSV